MSEFTNPAGGAGDAAEAYINATLAMLGDRDPRDVLRGTPPELERVVNEYDPVALSSPEAPGKWSAAAVIQHLADSEVAWAWRLRSVLAEDRPLLAGYDQDAWAVRLGYDEAVPADSLRQFRVLREGHLKLIAELDRQALARVGVHGERGEESVAHMIRLYAGHDLVHLRQLSRVLETVAG